MAVRTRTLSVPATPPRRSVRRRRRRRALLDAALAPLELILVLAGRTLALLGRCVWSPIERRLPERGRAALRRWAAYLGCPARPLRRTVAVSTGLHLGTGLFLLLCPAHSREPRWLAPPMVVSLVTLEEPETRPATKAAAPKPAVQKPKPKPKREETPPTPERKDAPRIAERKPETAQKTPPVPPPREAARPDSLRPQRSSSPNLRMAARVDEAAFVFDYYLQQVVDRISAAWSPPAGIAGREEGPKAVVRFRIHRNGSVSGVAVEETSELGLFDRSTLEAIAAAHPLLPLPPAYGGDHLTVHLRFVYSDPRPAGLR